MFGLRQGVAESKEDKIKQLKRDYEVAFIGNTTEQVPTA